MYRLLKDKGNYSQIIIKNTDTNATVMIGKISIEILNIMEKAGITMGGETKLLDEWDIPISMELASELTATTMKMKKPVIKRKDSTSNNDDKKQINKNIDAMDVLLGLVNYVE